MKKLLWTSAIALTAAACMTACDDSSSGASNSIPEFKTEAALPDTCEMEVAKAGDTYFACFENKWIEVTDSATVEQFKEGLDEDEIKAKLEELEDQLKPATPAKPKSSSSKKTDEYVDSSDSDEPESSASEECTGRRCNSDGKSSSSKKSSGGSGSGEGGEGGEGGSSPSSSTSGSSVTRDEHFKLLDEFVDWKSGTKAVVKTTIDPTDMESALKSDGFDVTVYDSEDDATTANLFTWMASGVNLGIQKDNAVFLKTNNTPEDSSVLFFIVKEEASDMVGYAHVLSRGKCGTSVYFKDTQICEEGKVLTKCGTETFAQDFSNIKVCDEGVIKGICGENYDFYDPKKEFCDGRDQAIYKYVTIGTQTWMAENLNYETTTGSSCYNDAASCSGLGRLYTLSAADESVCPNGWHLPNNTEWELLKKNAGGDADAAQNLKAYSSGWDEAFGTDKYGFAAEPAGIYDGKIYTGKTIMTAYWSSTIIDEMGDMTYYHFTITDEDEAKITTVYTNISIEEYPNRYSVRCIKDAE